MPTSEFVYQARSEDKVEPLAPYLTFFLVLLCVWAFFEATGHGSLWVKNHAFSGGKFDYHIEHGLFTNALGMMFWATFASANLAQFIGNMYFLWVFGSTVEVRLGPLRYLLIVAACLIGGWALLGFEIGSRSPALYLGAGLFTCGIIGAYLNFFPEKKINPGGSFKTHKFFRETKDPNPAESFGISPWWLMLAFVAYEVVMHFVLGNSLVRYDTMTIFSAICSLFIGLLLALGLIVLSTRDVSGHPLKRLAIQKYQQLRRLDMTHEQAVRGCSKLLSVPAEQVNHWVSQGSGPLPQTYQS